MDRRIKTGMTLEEYLALPLSRTEEGYLEAHRNSRDQQFYKEQIGLTRYRTWQTAHTPLPDLEEKEG